MAKQSGGGAALLVLAALLAVGWWWRTTQVPRAVAARPAAQGSASGAHAKPPATPSRPPRGTLPGITPPSIESATPAELAALRDAEVERSAASPPVASYRGSDGRQHAFDYSQAPAAEAAQRDEDSRREAVLAQMRADPANFAARNGLQPREVEKMLDGSLPVPERLLH